MAKQLVITVKEKGTDNVTLRVEVSGVPANLKELAELTEKDEETQAYSCFESGLQAVAKSRCSNGEKIDYSTLLKRSGRRTQSGLVESIMTVIPKVAVVAPVLVADFIALQAQVMGEFKGHADEYYNKYHELYAQYEEASAK